MNERLPKGDRERYAACEDAMGGKEILVPKK